MKNIFQNEEHFQEGNYYEVIYLTLKKAMSNKNMKVTKLVFDCLTELFGNLPTMVKVFFIHKYVFYNY